MWIHQIENDFPGKDRLKREKTVSEKSKNQKGIRSHLNSSLKESLG
jgi:hypothetical protein